MSKSRSKKPSSTPRRRASQSKLPRGMALLQDPRFNKGLAFTAEEREALGMRGLLPPHVNTQDEQVARVMSNYHKKPNDLEKYVHLIALQDRNETLFYRVIMQHVEEMMPIIYTPTVGKACQEYGHIFRRPRGIYLSANDRGSIQKMLRHWPDKDVRVIVVTDGERILGLGDLGAFGMGIPVGKLSLYTACAGIDPRFCLPVLLDVGTDNESLLKDPLYTGLRQKRVRGAAYDELVHEFVMAVQKLYPKALIQFEDFANTNAFRLLRKYQSKVCTFNDDIQGTASVALAGVYSSLRLTGGELENQKILFLGAGEAGIGIGELIVAAMEHQGVPQAEARRHCWFVDSQGLVVKSRTNLAEHKLQFAHDHPACPDLATAIDKLKPNILIGVSGMPGSFTKPVVQAMSRYNKRPVIFALSNPTSKAECTAEQAYTWSEGRAIFASGSPFPPVTLGGRTFVPGQGNNAYIFPGVGLGVIACEAKRVTESMFFQAARALADEVLESDLDQGRVYPSLQRIQEVSSKIAAAVVEEAYALKLARKREPKNILEFVKAQMYRPEYASYV